MSDDDASGSDGSDVEYSYSDDDSASPDSPTSKPKKREEPVDRTAIKILNQAGVREKIEAHVAEVAEMMGLTPDAAQLMCQSERWCTTDALVERWFTDPAKVAASAGIAYPSGGGNAGGVAEAPAAAGPFTCPVCSEEISGAEDGFVCTVTRGNIYNAVARSSRQFTL